MNPSVYLDTTIPSYLYDRRESVGLHIEVTNRWWMEEGSKYEIWTSEETVREITDGAAYPRKSEILHFMTKIPLLAPNPKITDIAQIYIDNYLMPGVLKGDASHLAYASFYKMDFLLTWNCNHLANANKRRHIRVINTRLNLPTPEIITPLELFSENIDDYQ